MSNYSRLTAYHLRASAFAGNRKAFAMHVKRITRSKSNNSKQKK